jgi:hypothetical protein
LALCLPAQPTRPPEADKTVVKETAIVRADGSKSTSIWLNKILRIESLSSVIPSIAGGLVEDSPPHFLTCNLWIADYRRYFDKENVASKAHSETIVRCLGSFKKKVWPFLAE